MVDLAIRKKQKRSLLRKSFIERVLRRIDRVREGEHHFLIQLEHEVIQVRSIKGSPSCNQFVTPTTVVDYLRHPILLIVLELNVSIVLEAVSDCAILHLRLKQEHVTVHNLRAKCQSKVCSYGHLDLELYFFLVNISADRDSYLVAHLNLDFFAHRDGLDYAVWRRIYVAQWAQGHSKKNIAVR